jgi:hypothetical protein
MSVQISPAVAAEVYVLDTHGVHSNKSSSGYPRDITPVTLNV